MTRPVNLITALVVLSSLGFQLAVYVDHVRWDRDVRALRAERETWSARETAKLVARLGAHNEETDEAAMRSLVRERLPDAAEIVEAERGAESAGRFSLVRWSEPTRGWLVEAVFDRGRLDEVSVTRPGRTPRVRPQVMLRATASLWLTLVLATGTLAAVIVLLFGTWGPLRHAGAEGFAIRAIAVATAGTPLLAWDHAKLAVFAFPLIVLAAALASLRTRRRAWRLRGRCIRCAYDLRGNTSGTCPECGTPITDPSNRLA